jgi:hypothetical protein
MAFQGFLYPNPPPGGKLARNLTQNLFADGTCRPVLSGMLL